MILSKIAFRNAIKNWRKSLAAIISISTGFCSYVIFQGYMTDVEKINFVNFSNRFMNGDIIIDNPAMRDSANRANPEKFWIPSEHQEMINDFLDQHPLVQERMRSLNVTGMVSNGMTSVIFIGQGYDIEAGAEMRGPIWKWNALYGKPLHLAENEYSVLVGRTLSRLIGCTPEKQAEVFTQNFGYTAEVRPFDCENPTLQLSATTESGQLNALDLELVGITDAGIKDLDQRFLTTSLENLQMLMNTDKVQSYAVMSKSADGIESLLKDFNQFASRQQLPYIAQKWQDHVLGFMYRQIQALLTIFQAFIVTVIITISGLSVLNTMLKAVKERTREIGTLRSIGFTSGQMNLIFSLEAAYLSLMGIVVGSLVSVAFTLIINNAKIIYKAGFLSEPVVFQIALDWEAYAMCGLLLTTLSMGTSYLASRSISKTTVAENLTHV